MILLLLFILKWKLFTRLIINSEAFKHVYPFFMFLFPVPVMSRDQEIQEKKRRGRRRTFWRTRSLAASSSSPSSSFGIKYVSFSLRLFDPCKVYRKILSLNSVIQRGFLLAHFSGNNVIPTGLRRIIKMIWMDSLTWCHKERAPGTEWIGWRGEGLPVGKIQSIVPSYGLPEVFWIDPFRHSLLPNWISQSCPGSPLPSFADSSSSRTPFPFRSSSSSLAERPNTFCWRMLSSTQLKWSSERSSSSQICLGGREGQRFCLHGKSNFPTERVFTRRKIMFQTEHKKTEKVQGENHRDARMIWWWSTRSFKQ